MLMDDVTRPTAAGGRLRHLLGTLRERFTLWSERERERRWLADANDHLLKDIGMSRDAMRREVRKPFWKP